MYSINIYIIPLSDSAQKNVWIGRAQHCNEGYPHKYHFNRTRCTQASFGVGYSKIHTTVFWDYRCILQSEDVHGNCRDVWGTWSGSRCTSLLLSPPGFAHQPPEQTTSIYALERAAACHRMNGGLENCAVIHNQGSVSTPSHITYGFWRITQWSPLTLTTTTQEEVWQKSAKYSRKWRKCWVLWSEVGDS